MSKLFKHCGITLHSHKTLDPVCIADLFKSPEVTRFLIEIVKMDLSADPTIAGTANLSSALDEEFHVKKEVNRIFPQRVHKNVSRMRIFQILDDFLNTLIAFNLKVLHTCREHEADQQFYIFHTMSPGIIIVHELLMSVFNHPLHFRFPQQLPLTQPLLSNFILPEHIGRAPAIRLFQAGACVNLISSECSIVRNLHSAYHQQHRITTDLCKALILERHRDIIIDYHGHQSGSKFGTRTKRFRELKIWHEAVNRSPSSLACQCRTSIRKHLSLVSKRRNILILVQTLPLPNILKQYLIYEGFATEVDLRVSVHREADKHMKQQDFFKYRLTRFHISKAFDYNTRSAMLPNQ